MKIAFFHELHFGGARRVVVEYGKVFSKKHDISIYYVGDKEEVDLKNVFPRSYNYYHPLIFYTGGNWKRKLYKDFIEPWSLYALHKKIAKDIDQEGYDFIFVHPSQFTHAPFILRFLKTPVVYFCQEPLRIAYDPIVTIPSNINFLKKLYERLIRKFKMVIDSSNIRHATIVLANCHYSEKNIKKAYCIDSFVCYLGVDPKLFKPLNIKKEFDILFVGDAIYMEGYDTLLEICKYFRIKPTISIVKKEKGKYISDKDLVKRYNRSKVVVILGRYDPFSMIPLEAMACKVPPVVVEEGGPIEAIVDKKTGYLVKRDSKKLYAIINKLLLDSSLRKNIAEQGYERINQFWTWEKSADRVMKAVADSKILEKNERK
ncbi:MAG TPA: glycosyltransferase family 4 protein [Candidatus Sulfotelmatobacter sp.]|jgi:glycosyltransferase involved in cell wall biosynthesis|nr:glycosyltransferase family 4 protein [Candidatus Sulfotelmatobacter sp.]